MTTTEIRKPMKFNSKGSVIFQEMSQIDKDVDPDLIINEESNPVSDTSNDESDGSGSPETMN